MDAAPKTSAKTAKTTKDGLRERAAPGCRHCHGRGYTGYKIGTDSYVVCRCVRRTLRRQLLAEEEVKRPKTSEPPPPVVDPRRAQLLELADQTVAKAEANLRDAEAGCRESLEKAQAAVNSEAQALAQILDERSRVLEEVVRLHAEAHELRESAREIVVRAASLDVDAEDLDRENGLQRSETGGARHALRLMQGQVNRVLHRARKQLNEAHDRADKLRFRASRT